MLDNVPLELRTYAQWILWRYEESEGPKPTKIPYDAKTHKLASVNDPETWTTYDAAVAMLNGYPQHYNGIGFVITKDDPYTFIDLDNPYEKKPDGTFKHFDPAQVLTVQRAWFESTSSYAEFSPSGTGLHIITRGAIPEGRRRGSIEVYSDQRYMTVTGNVLRNTAIANEQPVLDMLFAQLSEGRQSTTISVNGTDVATFDDDMIIEQASGASNGDLFKTLFNDGNWQLSNYPSQSEADFALVDIIQYYTKNVEQIERVFMRSELAKRKKSARRDYINRMINRSFDNTLAPIDVPSMNAMIASAKAFTAPQIIVAPDSVGITYTPPVDTFPASSAAYSKPVGLVGEIAEFIYQQAPRQVAEIALAGAIGLVAGIAGQTFNVSSTGLNQYVLLLAPTGTGKEAIASGIGKLFDALKPMMPSSTKYYGPGEIASPSALAKYLTGTSSCFVSVIGEVGLMLKQLTSDNAAPHHLGLKRMLLDLYNKSGATDSLMPTIYSDASKSTAVIRSPALTIVGESTPESYYQNLNESMISSGFLPRFTVIEYHGKRPVFNENHAYVKPDPQMIAKLANLVNTCLQHSTQQKTLHVKTTTEAQQTLDRFNTHCDLQINSTDAEVRRHLWNRAHIKALKLAAVIAVGGPIVTEPVITQEIAQWAIDVVVTDVRNLLKRFDAGEIGIDNDETKQLAKVIEMVRAYIIAPFDEIKQYLKGCENMHAQNVIPIAYVQRRLTSAAVFRNDRRGANFALSSTIKTLIERGDIAEVSRQDTVLRFASRSRAFMITNAKAFDL